MRQSAGRLAGITLAITFWFVTLVAQCRSRNAGWVGILRVYVETVAGERLSQACFVGQSKVYFCWIKRGLHEAILSSTAMVGKRFLAFCAYMTVIYLPFDLFFKPVSDDQEVWFGILFSGWAAKWLAIPIGLFMPGEPMASIT